jgi:hydrogenase nickel incorporation protein HypA/HybF
MHETAIVEDMFRIIGEVARKENLSRIDKVHFSIGEMMQIVPDLFRFAFDAAKENTIAKEAELEIEFLPVKMRCKSCGHEFVVRKQHFSCDACGSFDLDMIQGREMLIKSIEGE